MESDFEKSVRLFLAHPPFGYRNVPAEALELFCAALTHDSYANEHGGESYERLEFLGDTVLEFVVCESVFRDTDLREGAMTDFKQDKVANHRLSERILAYGLDIDGAMRVGGGHRAPDGTNIVEENMRADSMEAILAAVYLSYGMDEVRRIVGEVLMAELPEGPE
ncbi:MAG: ribonuclease III domain-containing protein [Thermoplasmata archaeon]|nr:ribonuclease III domain-containing protein [Thermoplasmata archaeon]